MNIIMEFNNYHGILLVIVCKGNTAAISFSFICLAKADQIKSEEIEGPLAAAAASTTRHSTAGAAAAAAGVPQTSDMITCFASMKGTWCQRLIICKFWLII